VRRAPYKVHAARPAINALECLSAVPCLALVSAGRVPRSLYGMTCRITKTILQWVPPNLHSHLKKEIRAANWMGALILCSSQDRISLCIDLFVKNHLSIDALPAVLAIAISMGDNPAAERNRLAWLLEHLREAPTPRRVFDGDAARSTFAALPEQVTIYRGTVEAEGTDYGVCWTLDQDKARWFATKHGRFRNTRSPAVLLTADVTRAHIAGLLFDRDESEVLVCPDHLRNVRTAAA
jgi:hypothetical protein